MKRKGIAILLTMTLFNVCLAGCGQTEPAQESNTLTTQDSQTEMPSFAPESSNNETGASTETANNGEAPVVYMTTEISSEGIMAIYDALGASPAGNIAVKLSTGEPGSNYLRTDLVGELMQSLDATIVECNTAYGLSLIHISEPTRPY